MNKEETKINNLYIVGAGFDKSVDLELPLNDYLLPGLVKKFPGAQQVEQLIDKYQTTSIEHILTYLDLEIACSQNGRRQYFENARNWIKTSLFQYFEGLRFGEAQAEEWTKSFAEGVLQSNDMLVSLNYSCILDGVLDFYEVWSPWHGYSRHIENGAVEISADQKIGKRSIADNEMERKNIRLCKIHGSVHFKEIEFLDDSRSNPYISFPISSALFPKNAPNTNFVAGYPDKKEIGYIIPPSFIKMFYVQIRYMMDEILCAARVAKKLIILGCGMRPEDSFLWNLLCAFLVRNYKAPEYSDKRLIILDTNAKLIMQHIRDYFDVAVGGFFEEDNRAIPIEGFIHERMDELKKIVIEQINEGDPKK